MLLTHKCGYSLVVFFDRPPIELARSIWREAQASEEDEQYERQLPHNDTDLAKKQRYKITEFLFP